MYIVETITLVLATVGTLYLALMTLYELVAGKTNVFYSLVFSVITVGVFFSFTKHSVIMLSQFT
jgi:hypothetical protein